MQSQPFQDTPTAKAAKSSPYKKRPLDSELLAFARKLPQEHSDAVRLMWALLRNRRFCGFKFRRQHLFKPYVLDFYCEETKLAVELDGSQHNTETARGNDLKRTEFLQSHGIIVVRFWNHEVLGDLDAVLEAIHIALTPALSRRERES